MSSLIPENAVSDVSCFMFNVSCFTVLWWGAFRLFSAHCAVLCWVVLCRGIQRTIPAVRWGCVEVVLGWGCVVLCCVALCCVVLCCVVLCCVVLCCVVLCCVVLCCVVLGSVWFDSVWFRSGITGRFLTDTTNVRNPDKRNVTFSRIAMRICQESGL